MSQFSTNEAVSLEKQVETVLNPATKFELIDEVYELQRCAGWIKANDFQKVCLQFPDHLLQDSSEVALRLGKQVGRTVYILADTAYESCCIDYVAAGHINADAIIHFGPVCFSKTSANIPYLNIYEKDELDLGALEQCLVPLNEKIVILLDTSFIHLTDKIVAKFPDHTIKTINSDNLTIENDTVVFIGGRNHHRKLPNLKFSHKPKTLYYFNDKAPSLINYTLDEKVLRRRYFLVEKIKDSNTVGIVIGTLGVSNYLKAIERLKKLLTLHSKKYYLVSVGKPTVAKLANFPEIDIYVVVTCALNEIYDSRDYYKPIVTIYDVEMALNPAPEGLEFTYDYNDVITRPLNDVTSDPNDVSLLTGRIRGTSTIQGAELVSKEAGTVALNTNHGAGFLANRTWKGLERDVGGDEVKMASEGRRGIAQSYNDETSG
ncbi:2-(3-amino-3-carboxypropyl)histidine synthase subunit 2 [Tribolium castaneum]|uniref:Diphthamide biosynthesis protein 2-like Protein n=1 Tax=Tribolium castaneum TaxID=7070 RepID=D2A3S7_TRICA|nr:PREDICTED: diphthamide biosynthesis protein 2 [Tribolium castaneum]EFA05560.1 Diphthamide biosynthesis protein 2-like Protein [Tribolium castaneum]|eukprot:XP_015836534.1 PREDICTED: diphthamide biosynthesis protein 2 [Tribolium castaneum]